MRKLIVLAVLLAGPAIAADKAPSWLSEMATRQTPSYGSDVPAVVLFEEERVMVSPDGKVQTAVRKAVKILKREGRREARAAVVYRTETGKVRNLQAWTLYPSGDVKEYRKKETMDVSLADNDVYNESRVQVISGSSDVDPGTVFGFESLLEDRSIFTQFSYDFQDDLPSLTSRFVLSLPPGWTAQAVVYNHEGIEPAVDGSTYTWQLQNLAPVEVEPFMPRLTSLVPRVNVSYFPAANASASGQTFKDWQQVSSWLESLHAPQAAADEAVAARAKQLIEGKQTEFGRIAAIAEFAQRIKYVSIQTGVGRGGGYQPHAASEVMQNAYGDCKDKANLMRAMLKSVGIESYPLTIYSGDRNYVREDWASPQQFNHAIIAVKVSDETEAPAVLEHEKFGRLLLFDPTDSHTPPGYLPEDEQGSLALIITSEGGELIRAPAVSPEGNMVKREVQARLGEDGAIKAEIQEYLTGSSASENRSLYSRLTREEYRKVIERWVARGAPGSAVSKIEAGEQGGGGFFVNVEMSSPRYSKLMGQQLMVFKPAVVARRSGTSLTANERKHPVVLNADAYAESVEVELPPGFAVDEMSEPVALETDFGSYEAEWRTEAGKLYFNRSLKIRHAIIEPSEYATVKDFFDQMVIAEQASVVLSRK